MRLPALSEKDILNVSNDKGAISMELSNIRCLVGNEGNIVAMKVQTTNGDNTVRKLTLKIGEEYVVSPLNPKKMKNRGRRVLIRDFTRTEKGDAEIRVKYLDNNKAGKAIAEDLDVIDLESTSSIRF